MSNDTYPKNTTIDDGLTVLKSWSLPNVGAQFDEVESPLRNFLGTRITQDEITYIGRNWKLTEEVKGILSKAADLGVSKFLRKKQPQNSYHLGGKRYYFGCPHIGCSKPHSDDWIFALDTKCLPPKKGEKKIKSITFNKKFVALVREALNENINYQKPIDDPFNILGRYEIEKGAGENIITHPDDFNVIIEYIAKKL